MHATGMGMREDGANVWSNFLRQFLVLSLLVKIVGLTRRVCRLDHRGEERTCVKCRRLRRSLEKKYCNGLGSAIDEHLE
jgi:hypothetical protein